MIVKTRSLTESLEKLYEAYEVETDDELDAIMDDDTLSDEEKEAEIGRVLDKHDKLNEAENPENAEINSVIRRTVGKKNISKKDAQALADAGIERDEYGDLTGKNGRRLVKSGTAIHGPGKTYHKYPKTDYRKGYDGKTTRWDLRRNSADMVASKHADKWDKVDLKNYLDSEKPHNEWEAEQEMDKKLRPYSDKYQELKRQKANAEWDANWDSEKIKSEEEIEKLVQEYRDKLMKQRAYHMKELEREEGSKEFYDKQIKDLQAQAKAKHPQYESLNEAATNTVIVEDEETHRFISKHVTFDDPDSLFTEPGDIDEAKLFDKYSWEEEVQEYLDELTDGSYDLDDFRVYAHFNESLNESSHARKSLTAIAAYAFEGSNFTNVVATKEKGGIRVDFDEPARPLSERTADNLAQKIEDISGDSRISVYPDVIGDTYIIFDVSYMTESLNEAQLNENPLVAAAARAAIPAAIDVASNAISSVIDAKLNDSKDTELNEAEGSDNELSFDEIMAKEKTSGNMDWYKKDKPNWKQVTEEE